MIHRRRNMAIQVAVLDQHRARLSLLRLVAGAFLVVFLVALLSAQAFAQQELPDDNPILQSMRIQQAEIEDTDPDFEVSAAHEVPPVDSTVRLLVDTDPGVDDAAALASLLSHETPVELLGIVTVFGNSSPVAGANTVLNLLDLAGRSDIPVVIGGGSPCPASGETGFICPGVGFALHGPDGLWGQSAANMHPGLGGLPTNANDFYCGLHNEKDWQGATLLALGPLTNVAAAIERCPGVMTTLGQVIALGGAKGGGNLTPVAEFNIWQNAGAAEDVVAFRNGEGFPALDTTLVPLEAYSQLSFGQKEIDKLAHEGNAAIQFVLPALQIYKDVLEFNGGKASLPDVTAAALAVNAKFGDSQPALVKVMNPDPGNAALRQVRGQTIVGLDENERVVMIAGEEMLIQLSVLALTDPALFFQVRQELLASDPENVQFVTDIKQKQILKAFIKTLMVKSPEDPSGAALSWVEEFDLPDGTTVDNGETAWSLINTGPNMAKTIVNGGVFEIRNTQTEITWSSEVIDTAGAAGVFFSLDLWAPGSGYESSGTYVDYVEIYYRLDNGPLQFIEAYYGPIAGTVTVSESGPAGDTLQIIVKARSTADHEHYQFDNVVVKAVDRHESADAAAMGENAKLPKIDGEYSIYLPVVVQ